MPDDNRHKKNKGAEYAHNAEFAEEVLAKNAARPAENNPKFNVKK